MKKSRGEFLAHLEKPVPMFCLEEVVQENCSVDLLPVESAVSRPQEMVALIGFISALVPKVRCFS